GMILYPLAELALAGINSRAPIDFLLFTFMFQSGSFWLLFLAWMAFWMSPMLLLLRRRRRNLRLMPAPVQLRLTAAAYGIREGLGKPSLVKWKDVKSFEFLKRKQGRYRIRIRPCRGWGMTLNLDADLPDTEADWLRQ